MRFSAAVAAATIAAGLVVVAGNSASATSDIRVAIPQRRVNDVAVDPVHEHVFISTRQTGTVDVRAVLDGVEVKTITGLGGATGMTLSPDSSTLYVALSNAIAVVDTTTLTEVARYGTGDGVCPWTPTLSGTLLWFGYGCIDGMYGYPHGNVGVLDLAADPPAFSLARLPAEYGEYQCVPQVALTADAGRMVTGCGNFPMLSLPVSGTSLGSGVSRDVGTYLDFALAPDEASVIVATWGPAPRFARYATSDLTDLPDFGVADTANRPEDVAVAGGYVLTGSDAQDGRSTILRAYTPDGTLLRTSTPAVPAHLSVSADGHVLARVTGYDDGPQHYLNVVLDPAKPPTPVSLTAPTSAKINVGYAVSGSVGAGSGATLHVTRSSPYGRVTLPDVTAGANGAFSIPDKVAQRGTYTYRVVFPGDGTHGMAWTSTSFHVVGLTPSITITADKTSYLYHQTATVTAHLGTTHGSRVLKIAAKTAYQTTYTTLRSASVDMYGNLRATYTMTMSTTFTATYGGDDVYEPRSVGFVRSSTVGLTSYLTGYYATSGSYRLYHRTTDPGITTKTAPSRGEACTSWQAQEYYSGAWHTVARNGCIPIRYSTGTAQAVFTGTHPVGPAFRIQSTFNGDWGNLRTVGPWVYLRFTS
jgi:hypothetical protein